MDDLTLSAVLAEARGTDDGLVYPAPENWRQGRTAYGGFTAALMLDAALQARDGMPPLRSALIDFTAPVSEPPTMATEVLRAGRNVTTLNTRALINGSVAAQGTFAFGASQVSELQVDCAAPDAPTPQDSAPFFPPGMTRSPVKFFDNFEVRLIDGARPFSGASRGYVRVWARHKDPAARSGIVPLLCIADILPPAAFPMLSTIGPNSSMTWICNFPGGEQPTEDGWFMIETSLTTAQAGYSSQVMRAWTTEGTLVVEGMQSVIIFV